MKPDKVYLKSVACFIVQTETNQIAAYLEGNGYQLVDTVEKADAIILTTCAVTQHSSDHTYNAILDCLARRKNNSPLYIVGCYSRIEIQKSNELHDKHENIFFVPEFVELEDIFIGNNTWEDSTYNDFFSYPYCQQKISDATKSENTKFGKRLKALSLIGSVLGKDLLFYYLLRQNHLYSIYVQMKVWPVLAAKGCTHACTYCAVRIGRGKFRSKPVASVITEMKTGASKGYDKCLLIGDELGPYGVDFKDGTTLATLLESIIAEDIPVKIGLWYVDCFKIKEIVPALETLAEKDRLFLLGIPFQSGSRRILDLMNRRYSLEDALETVGKLRKYPGVIIASQFMVGFPTETEEDFRASVELVEKGYFDKVEVYSFSPRPGTRAAKMENDVPDSVKEERNRTLSEIAARKGRKLLVKHLLHEVVA
ncbi:MAG: tRNA (N6-isopentenyl adenosine(37)-C2)-methylthiotransferase MiaB [Candidatus Abyssubacteria bacterium]